MCVCDGFAVSCRYQELRKPLGRDYVRALQKCTAYKSDLEAGRRACVWCLCMLCVCVRWSHSACCAVAVLCARAVPCGVWLCGVPCLVLCAVPSCVCDVCIYVARVPPCLCRRSCRCH